MSGPFRLDGGLVDRSRSLDFRFDGRRLTGHPGDTLASALLANGVRLVARSFKYHRPRGVFTAGSEEPNALVELRSGAHREPNTRATVTELFDGLEASSQHYRGSLRHDLLAFNDLLAPFLSAGFYYKTFMWPKSFWERVYEPAIRAAAGLGRLSGAADPDRYDKGFLHCDLLIIGAGPAGLAAALAAGRSGARVILADEDFVMGGRLNAETHEVDGRPGADWAMDAVRELASMDSVRLLPRTTVIGAYDHGIYGTLERRTDHLASSNGKPRQVLWRICSKRAILTAGATERPIAFGGNDRPGVMLAGAVRTYANRFAVGTGRRIGVFTNNDDGWRTAADLAAKGVEVAAVIDVRDREPLAEVPGARTLMGGKVKATWGRHGVNGVVLATGERIALDCLAVSGGWNPNVHLTCHHGGRPYWRDDIAAFVPGGGLPAGMTVAGAANGAFQRPRPRWTTGIGAAVATLGRSRLFCCSRRPAGCKRRGCRGFALLACPGEPGPGVAGFAERRDGEGCRAGAPGGLPLGRASEALHHPRHGDRPGQDGQCRRARHHGGTDRPDHCRDRHDRVPPALYAGADRRFRRALARQGLPPDPPDAEPRLGGRAGRRLRRGRHVAARPVVSAARRDPLAAVGRPGGSAGPRLGRHLRCHDPGQDRYPGPGRRGIPQQSLRQRLCQARGRQGALRPDAARGRHRLRRRHDRAARRKPFRHDDDDGERRCGVPQHGVRPPVLVAGLGRPSDLRDRTMGAVRRRRPECAQPAAQDRRSGARYLQRGLPLHGLRRAQRVRRHAGAAVPHLLLRRTGLRDRRAGALWRSADGSADGGGRGIRRGRLRHRGARRHARRKGPCGGPRTDRPDDGADARHAAHGVEEEGLHRQYPVRAAGDEPGGRAGADGLQTGRSRRASFPPARISWRPARRPKWRTTRAG